MSNSVVFLLIAVGLSVLGVTAVWLHGRPRQGRKASNDYRETLRVLSQTRRSSDPTSGVTPIRPTAPNRSPRDPRVTKPTKERDPGA